MSDLALQLPLEQAKEGVRLAPDMRVDPTAQDAARRQHHKERLARLFRHTGESTEGRYLMDILTCYRGAKPS